MTNYDPLSYAEAEETFDLNEKLGIEGLSQDDYTLNSPLILDSSLSFFQFLFLDINPNPYFSRAEWVNLKINFQKEKRKIRHYIPFSPEQNHKIWAQISLRDIIDSVEITNLIDKVNKDVLNTYPVLQSFLRGWIGRGTLPPIKKIKHGFILKYGQLFYETHKLILILNCKTKNEYENLKENFKFHGEFVNKSETVTVIELKNLGKTVLGGGFIWFSRLNMFLDRNFLLMMKDTWLARFNNLLSLIGRVDNMYTPDFVLIVEEFYRIGDLILVEEEKEGYQALKLLEPMCLDRLEQIVKERKPLLPPFIRFHNHIQQTIDGLLIGRFQILRWRTLLQTIRNEDCILSIFGAFRHWGHPYLNYLVGLDKLYTQVNLKKNIDEDYCGKLASDLAKIVLTNEFKEKKTWSVVQNLVSRDHPLYNHIKNNTWPTGGEISNIGDIWHTLPLKKCFEVPDMLEPSAIYADKSHSLNRSQVIDHIKKEIKRPIPSKKVLLTLLETEGTDWKTLFERINAEGLTEDELVIGLKGKERELKPEGRFFALMSWVLREYFVITEYLIKKYYVPLFKGLTMADDLTEVLKKLLESSAGQGDLNVQEISIANHIDYEKWNNHQRHESTHSVFKVMDQFLGFDNVISRTHEFFQKSLIYYNDRPDLMRERNGRIECKGRERVTWEGQMGGLEGLRQKGWTIVGMLSIKRESAVRNTQIKVLAQGDNQVVCTRYKLPPVNNDLEVAECLKNAAVNNSVILDAIIDGSRKLGLVINRDETIQSADLLIYGKIPIIYGCIRSIESKRYSRISCTTNDQIPSLPNVMSTVNTACLTISHQSSSPIEAMRGHCFFGNLVRNLIELHDPMLQNSINKVLPESTGCECVAYQMCCLYLDPSLGGICGISCNRFLIRMFPDPVTEALCFWKIVMENTTDINALKSANYAGNPQIETFNLEHLDKLLEDPLSLNLKKTISVTYLLKKEIKKTLEKNVSNIKNLMIKSSIEYSLQEESVLREFLFSIKPRFPRFLSEFRSATYFGVIDSISGLIVNSVTIRKLFKSKIKKGIDDILFRSEKNSIKNMCRGLIHSARDKRVWPCSSSKADALRTQSWGESIVGATVPHPSEFLKMGKRSIKFCEDCLEESCDDFITTSIPLGMTNYLEGRGPYPIYLGSKTQESTNLLQPWEKETKIPLLSRGEHLRTAINWFVALDSRLAQSIFSVLSGLTGEDWSLGQIGFKRTGSALHRFSSARQSTGGYCSISPCKLSRMVTTTDTLSTLGDQNYDFMYQSLILFVQISIGEITEGFPFSCVYHNHIKCLECVRPIEEPILESVSTYIHPDVSTMIKKWIPEHSKLSSSCPVVQIEPGLWESVSVDKAGFHLGRTIGFMFGDSVYSEKVGYDVTSLFPLSISELAGDSSFINGILDGILRAASLNVLHRRNSGEFFGLGRIFRGAVLNIINRMSLNTSAQSFFRNEEGIKLMSRLPHRVPPSYPLQSHDLGLLIKNYLENLFSSEEKFYGLGYKTLYPTIWIFSDIYVSKMAGLLILSSRSLSFVTAAQKKKKTEKELRKLKADIEMIRQQSNQSIQVKSSIALLSNHEVRSAGKVLMERMPKKNPDITIGQVKWIERRDGEINSFDLEYRQIGDGSGKRKIFVPKKSSPLISGLRIVQVATGSHYKIRAIFSKINLAYRDFLCGGDGSGGLTAFLLRWRENSRGIFNSLLNYEDCDMRGSHPAGPSAVGSDDAVSSRCVNYKKCWGHPSDLSSPDTWEYFLSEIEVHKLKIDLVLLDMEVNNIKMSGKIEDLLMINLHKVLLPSGTLIFKTYLTYLEKTEKNIVSKIVRYFKRVQIVQTSYTSMYSSEIYLVCTGLLSSPPLAEGVNWEKFFKDSKSVFCFSTQEKEFKRAREINTEFIVHAVPKELIPSIWSELTHLWERIGIPVGVASDLAYNAISLNKRELGEFFLSVALVAMNFLFPFTRNYDSPPLPPSDPSVINFGSLLTATLMWMGWGSGSRGVYNQGELLFNNSFPIFFKSKEVNFKRTKLKKRYVQTWNTSGPGINKTSRLNEKFSLIGSIIRVYARCTRDVDLGKLNKHRIYEFAQKINSSIDLRLVKQRTGFLELISNKGIFKNSQPRFEVTEGTMKENIWRD